MHRAAVRRTVQARAEQSWKIQPPDGGPARDAARRGLRPVQERSRLNREEAITALTEPDIEPCQICAPQTGLEQA
ncbi:DUF6233 domain-containing protein [Streptomyces sp. NPDC014724]|uniref:DUF6233 domain-containing protein n=1 Tax=unclassified Streptomyces TaxID=2593676 RepID=UPI0036F670D3